MTGVQTCALPILRREGKIGRIVGLSRGMRGNKRETRRKKTYTRKGKWQDSRSFERDERE